MAERENPVGVHLREGETLLVKGSAKEPYAIRMIDGIVSCSCPAWRNAGSGIDVRTCKHIKANIDPVCTPARDTVQLEKIDWDNLPPVTTDSGLYRIVCSVNGRFYIGEAQSFKKRWREHKRDLRKGSQPRPSGHRGKWGHHNKCFQEDYNRFGAEAFSYCAYRDIADAVERHAAEVRDIRACLGSDCYNISEFSPPLWARKTPKEQDRIRAKISATILNSPAALAKMSAANVGKKATTETRAKMSAAKKGRKFQPEHKARISAALQGRVFTTETRARLSAARKGKTIPIDVRAKISASLSGRERSFEHRARLSAALTGKTGRKHSPETLAKMSTSRMGRRHSLETRMKMVDSWKTRKANSV